MIWDALRTVVVPFLISFWVTRFLSRRVLAENRRLEAEVQRSHATILALSAGDAKLLSLAAPRERCSDFTDCKTMGWGRCDDGRCRFHCQIRCQCSTERG